MKKNNAKTICLTKLLLILKAQTKRCPGNLPGHLFVICEKPVVEPLSAYAVKEGQPLDTVFWFCKTNQSPQPTAARQGDWARRLVEYNFYHSKKL
ncbi:MAG: hypothetical protein PHG73_04245 [Pygmaiobacter sp.]|jgi:hypothetical protein|nr:hypothetical protein [Pygmaiobacter sp.]